MAVSWLERGDPAGVPVLHFHGWPSSRLEQFTSSEHIASHGLRWFNLDRPGYGDTEFKHPHTFLNWAQTIRHWADTQNIPNFHVSGFSGGGPFAQAVAAYLPDRVLSLHLVASLAPFGPNAVTVHPPWHGAKQKILDHTPTVALLGLHAFNLWRKLDPQGFERFQLKNFHPVDQAILDTPEILDRFAQSHALSMGNGVRHILADIQLYRSLWDFDPASIQCPTRIWVGDLDIQVPAACSYWLASRIPNAALKVFPGEAHYLAYKHAEEILSAIKE